MSTARTEETYTASISGSVITLTPADSQAAKDVAIETVAVTVTGTPTEFWQNARRYRVRIER